MAEKKKEKDVKKEKSVKDNKKIIYIIIALIIILVVVLLFLFNKSDNKKKPNNNEGPVVNDKQGVIEDKEYDGLKFTSTSLVYEDGMSTLVTTVTNPTDSDYYLNEFHIFVKDENNIDVISYEDVDGNTVNYLVGYVGDSIPAGESMDITTSIDFDISSYAHNISYEAVK